MARLIEFDEDSPNRYDLIITDEEENNMALNPSCNNVAGNGEAFPVLGDGPFKKDQLETAKSELTSVLPEAEFDIKSEVQQHYKEGSLPYKQAMAGMRGFCKVKPEDIEDVEVYTMEAKALGWNFHRAWYYWSCHVDNGKKIPTKIAKTFNETWGEQVRVNGYAGGTDVKRPVDGYHIDTAAGLQAFVDMLRKV